MLESIATPTDSIIVMARHLTKRTELDDLIRRAFKDSLEAILKFDVLVWVSTLRHKWAGDIITEETFLVAAVPAKAGGRIIGKSLPGLESDSSFFKLSFGSLELECFTDLKQVINKPWMTTFRPTETIEIGHVACGSSMSDILNELEGFSSSDILGISKCDPRSPHDRYEKWLLLTGTDCSTRMLDNPRPNWKDKQWSINHRSSTSPSKTSSSTKSFSTLLWDPKDRRLSKIPPTSSTPSVQSTVNKKHTVNQKLSKAGKKTHALSDQKAKVDKQRLKERTNYYNSISPPDNIDPTQDTSAVPPNGSSSAGSSTSSLTTIASPSARAFSSASNNPLLPSHPSSTLDQPVSTPPALLDLSSLLGTAPPPFRTADWGTPILSTSDMSLTVDVQANPSHPEKVPKPNPTSSLPPPGNAIRSLRSAAYNLKLAKLKIDLGVNDDPNDISFLAEMQCRVLALVQALNPIDADRITGVILNKDIDLVLHHIMEPESIRAAIISSKSVIAAQTLKAKSSTSLKSKLNPAPQQLSGSTTGAGHANTNTV